MKEIIIHLFGLLAKYMWNINGHVGAVNGT